MALNHFVRMDGTTKRSSAVIDTNIITEPMVNWGTLGGAEIGAATIPLLDAAGAFTATDVEAALAEVGARNFNTRRYLSGVVPIQIAINATIGAVTAADQVPNNLDEVIADQATTNWGTLLGATHIAYVGLPADPGINVAQTVVNRRILGTMVDVNGDPFLLPGGQEVFFFYETKRIAGATLFNAVGDTQIQLVYYDAGTWKSCRLSTTGATNVYTWPVIRYDLTKLPEDAMLYGGGGMEAIDNTPYTAGTGVTISTAYAIAFDQTANLAALTGTWTADIAGTASINFSAAGYSDGLVIPNNAGVPVGAGTEGAVCWDSALNNLYICTGAAWQQISSAAVLPVSGGVGETLVGIAAGAWASNAKFVANSSTGAITASIPTTTATALLVKNFTNNNEYLKIGTSAGTEALTFGNGSDNPDFLFVGSGPITQSGVGQVSFAGNVDATAGLDVTTAALTAAAALTVTGGAFTFSGSNINLDPTGTFDMAMAAGQTTSFHIPDALASAFLIENVGAGEDYFKIDTSTGAELLAFGNATDNPDFTFLGSGTVTVGPAVLGSDAVIFNVKDATASVFKIQENGNAYFDLTTSNGTEKLDFGNATINPDFNFLGTGSVAFGPTVLGSDSVTFSVKDNTATVFQIKENANNIMSVTSTNAAEKVDFGYNVNAMNGLDVTVADLTVGAFQVGPGDGIIDGGTWQATVIGPTYGGTGQNAVVTGDLLYGSGANVWSRRGIGATGQSLTVVAGVPAWAAPMNTGNVTLLAKSAIVLNKLVNMATTGDLEEADASGQTKISVVGVARVAQPIIGNPVDIITSGLAFCNAPLIHALIEPGSTAYLQQAAGGNVVMYSDIAYTGGMSIVPVGIFVTGLAANTPGAIAVMLGAVGTPAVLV